ncbi:phenylalanine--tRNA ligase subunit beta [bacterium]|nr:phenylalanine--tRNA ligase subunit beta [bacterium]
MKLSYNWLSEYLNLNDKSPEEVADILTDVGLEVEDIQPYSTIKNSLDGVLVGKVQKVWPHPNADKLRLTLVDIGGDQPLQIVCGAPNVAENQTVAVATIGTNLVFSDGTPLKIKKGKIRGEVSMGMICAEDELGVGESHAGIMVLNNNLEAGTPFAQTLENYSDTCIEVGLTPNRVDAACHRGAAIDLCAKLQRELKERTRAQIEASTKEPSFSISIQNTEACKRYAALAVKGIKVAESPAWLQNKLRTVGLQPINNVVDITNYVMFDLGQPLHAFDLQHIAGEKIVVRTAQENDKLTTLDKKERSFANGELLICDAEKPLAIAGVFGGLHSGVTDSTTEILLESAYFNPSQVRQSARAQQLSTDASFRFERGANIEMVPEAIKQAAKLICEVAGGTVDFYIDQYPVEAAPVHVLFSLTDFYNLAGIVVESQQVESILTALGFGIKQNNSNEWLLTVPANKPDVTRPVDVAEEVLRIYGYNNIPLPSEMRISVPDNEKAKAQKAYAKVVAALAGQGFHELKTSPFDVKRNEQQVEILNPLSAEMTHLRAQHYRSGLQSLAHNINRQHKNLRFFEIANEYKIVDGKYLENNLLSFWLTGAEYADDTWFVKNRNVQFANLKSVTEVLLSALGQQETSWKPLENAEEGHWQYALTNPDEWIRVGKLSPEICAAHDINQAVFYAQIDYKKLLNEYSKVVVVYQEPSKYPQMVRDLSFVLQEDKPYSEIMKAISSTRTKFLTRTNCFDLYKGKPLEKGFVSYALRFVFENKEKTLSDKQVEFEMEQLITSLEALGCQIRK